MRLLIISAFLILIMSIAAFADDGGGEGGEGGDGGCEGGGGGGGGGGEGGDGACEGGEGDGDGSPGSGSSCQCSSGQVQVDGACGLCGTLRRDCGGCHWGGWYCSSQGVCSPGQTQCSNGKYQTCGSTCGWETIGGTDADNDGVDLQCGDSMCDNSPGIFDSTMQQTEAVCTDSLDNNCNSLTDCQDTFCSSTIQGKVVDTSNNSPLEGSKIEVRDQNLNNITTAFTNSSGEYFTDVLCGTHNIIASKEAYISGTKSNVQIPPQSSMTEDFELSSGIICEADCTYEGDNVIHSDCSGINGCSFFDEQAAVVCDNAQPGWIRDYSPTQVIQCASGAPKEEVKVKATVTCEDENLIKTTKVVDYQGKLVKLVVVTCG